MTDIRACKATCKCRSLTSRGYYFEPNPATAPEWSASGLYTKPIDRRVIFVCESPGPQFRTDNQVEPSRCWAKTWQDDRFARAREEHGFLGCYLTNIVKCGVRSGTRHSDEELASCRGFLVRELDLVKPLVAVGVGGNAYRSLRTDVLPLLSQPPLVFELTHYSARGDIRPKWAREFAELRRLLGRLKPRAAW